MDNYNSRAERSCQSQVMSFSEACAAVSAQIELETIPTQDKAFAKNLANIMADVMSTSPEKAIKINGEFMPASRVTEVYREVDNDHVRAIIRNFRKIRHKIQNTTPYLRTALYNSVFELEAQTENEVAVDMPYLYEGGA